MVDISEAMLAQAKRNTPPEFRGNVDYVNAGVSEYESPVLFDVVLCVGVLAHVPSVTETIAKLSAFLKPGGRCVLEFTDASRICSWLFHLYHRVKVYCHAASTYAWPLNRLTSDQVLSVARSHHLEMIEARRHALLVPGISRLPASWLIRYELFVMKCPRLARHGSEVVCLFEKRPDTTSGGLDSRAVLS
jgi:SAM-dependent methyltransferase